MTRLDPAAADGSRDVAVADRAGAGCGAAPDPLLPVMRRLTALVGSAVTDPVDVSLVLLPDGRRGGLRCATGAAGLLEQQQQRAGSGPFVDAIRRRGRTEVPDTAAESRYLDFAAHARRAGVTRTVSSCLLSSQRPVGALSVYWRSGHGLDRSRVSLVLALAEHAVSTLAEAELSARRAEEVEQMREAMASRSTIEQAKGMLVATSGCSPEEAFALLRTASRRSNRKLRHLAEDMVTRRRWPG